MAHPPELHDELWKKRIARGETLNPSNASAWEIVQCAHHVESVLDAGCGTGLFLNLFPTNIKRVGVDFSPVAVEAARSKGIDAQVGDLDEKLPFPNGAFDMACSIQVLQHVKDPLFCLRELTRTSKKYVVVNVPNHLYWHFRTNMMQGNLPQVMRANTGHKNIFSLKKMEMLLRDAGLKVLARNVSGGILRNVHPSLFATGFSFLCEK